jgi:hypothetical protein
LHPLLRRNAAVIRRDPDFRADINRLERALRATEGTQLVDSGSSSADERTLATAPDPARVKNSKARLVIGGAITTAVLTAGVVFAPRFVSTTQNGAASQEAAQQSTVRPESPPRPTTTPNASKAESKATPSQTVDTAAPPTKAESAAPPSTLDLAVFAGLWQSENQSQCHPYWRISVNGDIVHWQSSTNRVSWTTVIKQSARVISGRLVFTTNGQVVNGGREFGLRDGRLVLVAPFGGLMQCPYTRVAVER